MYKNCFGGFLLLSAHCCSWTFIWGEKNNRTDLHVSGFVPAAMFDWWNPLFLLMSRWKWEKIINLVPQHPIFYDKQDNHYVNNQSGGQNIEISQQLWFNKDGNVADIHFITLHVGCRKGLFWTLTLLFIHDSTLNIFRLWTKQLIEHSRG